MLILWRAAVLAPGQPDNFSVTFAGQTPCAVADKRAILCSSDGKWHKNLKIMADTVSFQMIFFFPE